MPWTHLNEKPQADLRPSRHPERLGDKPGPSPALKEMTSQCVS